MPLTNPDYSNLNYDDMAKNIGLKAKHIPMLLASFLEESEPILEKLKIAIKSKDYETLRGASHSLKGSAGNLRFNEVYEMAKEMEFAAAESSDTFEYANYLEAMSSAISTIKV